MEMQKACGSTPPPNQAMDIPDACQDFFFGSERQASGGRDTAMEQETQSLCGSGAMIPRLNCCPALPHAASGKPLARKFYRFAGFDINKERDLIKMTYVIQENQCGYLLKNGVFQRLLRAGKYQFPKFLGYQVLITDADGKVDFKGIPYQVLRKDPQFAENTVHVAVPDDGIILHSVDGLFQEVLLDKEHDFWNLFHSHTFRTISLQKPEVEESVPRFIFQYIPASLYHKVEVGDGETALLYYDNIYQKQLSQGCYYFWSWGVKVTHKIVDLKISEIDISGQEILTADKVGVRLNVQCTYRVMDPVSMVEAIGDLSRQLYVFAQMAIREYVGQFRLDELLDQKEEIGHKILEILQQGQGNYFVAFLSAGIKDMILPGEIRDIMNTVLVAEKTAQANVITRREEVASTRSLLNTAKLMDENKTLFKLKELEYLERICDKVGNISLSGAGSILEQLGALMGGNAK